jgi:hypothetical protein
MKKQTISTGAISVLVLIISLFCLFSEFDLNLKPLGLISLIAGLLGLYAFFSELK